MKVNKRSFKTIFIFSLLVFMILILTMCSTLIFTITLMHLGLINRQKPLLLLVMFAFSSLIVGTILSKFAGKHAINTIIEISNATKEVAKGNFDIQLNEDLRAKEFHIMAHNFNIMTKELSKTELFRNDFIENVSHEFKTPLSAIEGYVTLLQSKELSEEKKTDYTNRILKSTKRLSTLTGNILLLSRLENQEIHIKKEKYSLDEQIREVILMFENEWSKKNIELDIDLDTIDYEANPELLSQVWQNIIGNAIKFSQNNGTIQIFLRQHPSDIRIIVSDNGIGMSPEITERIYEKFFQGDSSRSSSGNGLGLTLAKRITDLHHGTIIISSEYNRGTVVTVSLPLIQL